MVRRGGRVRGVVLGLLAFAVACSGDDPGETETATAGTESTGGTEGDPCSADIDIPDPALAGAIREQLGLAAEAMITGEELLELDILIANERGIADLRGLECATALEQLFLDGNAIVDLSPLADLPTLSNLHVGGNQIADLSPLTGNPTLFTLDVPENAVTSTAALVDMPALKNLDLRGNPITRFEGMTGLDTLFSLRAEDTPLTDLSGLAALPELDNAHFDGSALPDLGTLPDMPSLTWLTVGGAQLTAFGESGSLPSLTTLELGNNQIADLSGLTTTRAPTLRDLTLDGNPLGSLASLDAFSESLLVLHINDAGIDDASLAEMPNLAAALVYFDAADNQISDLTPLTSVEQLALARNQVIDVTPLLSSPPLKRLYLDDNQIADISPLTDVTFVECADVAIHGNPSPGIEDVANTLCAANIQVSEFCQPESCDETTY